MYLNKGLEYRCFQARVLHNSSNQGTSYQAQVEQGRVQLSSLIGMKKRSKWLWKLVHLWGTDGWSFSHERLLNCPMYIGTGKQSVRPMEQISLNRVGHYGQQSTFLGHDACAVVRYPGNNRSEFSDRGWMWKQSGESSFTIFSTSGGQGEPYVWHAPREQAVPAWKLHP